MSTVSNYYESNWQSWSHAKGTQRLHPHHDVPPIMISIQYIPPGREDLLSNTCLDDRLTVNHLPTFTWIMGVLRTAAEQEGTTTSSQIYDEDAINQSCNNHGNCGNVSKKVPKKSRSLRKMCCWGGFCKEDESGIWNDFHNLLGCVFFLVLNPSSPTQPYRIIMVLL